MPQRASKSGRFFETPKEKAARKRNFERRLAALRKEMMADPIMYRKDMSVGMYTVICGHAASARTHAHATYV